MVLAMIKRYDFVSVRCGCALIGLSLSAAGCASWRSPSGPGMTPAPTAAVSPSSPGLLGTAAETARGVSGQFHSMGTAVSGAYGKAKLAVSSALSTGSENSDPTMLSTPVPALSPEIFVATGQLYESTQQLHRAADNYSRALELEPTNPAALASLARLYARTGKSEDAIKYFQQAIAVSPQDAQLRADLGNLHAQIGQSAAATEHLQAAIQLQPNNNQFRGYLAGVMLDQGRGEEAVGMLTETLTPAAAHYQLALQHAKRQNSLAARDHLQLALGADPNFQPARDLVAQIDGSPRLDQVRRGVQTASHVMGVVDQTMSEIGSPSRP
jgi:Flp pilus assembly protein TadD